MGPAVLASGVLKPDSTGSGHKVGMFGSIISVEETEELNQGSESTKLAMVGPPCAVTAEGAIVSGSDE